MTTRFASPADDYPEAAQIVGPEGAADCGIGGIAAARDQHPADTRHVDARVERVPAAAEEWRADVCRK